MDLRNKKHRPGFSRILTIWGVSLTTLCLAVAAAVTIGQDQLSPDLQEHNVSSVEDLSNAFRSVGKKTFPGIIAIETRGKSRELTGGLDLEDLFKNDPRFKRFFQNNPELSPRQQPESPRRRMVPRGQGSGFIMDKNGHILTNNHVVQRAEEITVRLSDGREYEAEVVGTDARSDVAVIKIDPPDDLKPLPLGNSDDVEVGDFVLAFGSPFGLELTMTQGIISAKGRGPGINEREDYLQTDAAINPGNSGGPLVNLRGEVIGINTAISSRSGGYDGVGFSIPINMAKWVSDQIMETGRVKRAYIGVLIQQLNYELANQLGLDVNEGAIVSQIMEGSPSEKAGLETGDVILKLNGKKVTGTRQLQGIVEQLSVGETYPLLIYRDGEKKELQITMAEMPKDLSLRAGSDENSSREEDSEGYESSKLGVNVQQLTDDLAEQLGYPANVNGVVISSVEAGSVAELNGLQSGELIEKVGSTKINSIDDFKSAMEDADLEEGVLMLVRRGNLTRFIVVKDE